MHVAFDVFFVSLFKEQKAVVIVKILVPFILILVQLFYAYKLQRFNGKIYANSAGFVTQFVTAFEIGYYLFQLKMNFVLMDTV